MKGERVEALARRFARSRAEGDFRRLHRAIGPRLWLFALRLSRRDELLAEELVQETWLRAVRGLAQRTGQSRFTTWLLGIAVRTERELRRRARGVHGSASSGHDLRQLPVADPAPENALDLEAGLGELPPGARRVLLLHDLEGFTHAQIGELLGIAPGTSKSQLHEARKRMRAFLKDEAESHAPS